MEGGVTRNHSKAPGGPKHTAKHCQWQTSRFPNPVAIVTCYSSTSDPAKTAESARASEAQPHCAIALEARAERDLDDALALDDRRLPYAATVSCLPRRLGRRQLEARVRALDKLELILPAEGGGGRVTTSAGAVRSQHDEARTQIDELLVFPNRSSVARDGAVWWRRRLRFCSMPSMTARPPA